MLKFASVIPLKTLKLPLADPSVLVRSHPHASGASLQVVPERSSTIGILVGTLCMITIVTKIKVGRLPARGHSTNISRLFVIVTLVILVILVPKKGKPLIAGAICPL